MLDPRKVSEEITIYVRPQSFPVAFKMLESADQIPAKTRLPGRDIGIKAATCQCIGIARRYGWTVALTKEDHSCPLGMLALGFAKPNEFFLSGEVAKDMYCGALPAGAQMEAAVPRFAPAQYTTLLVGPLDRATFEPDGVIVYGNSAQVMRLVQGALFHRGGTLKAEAMGRIDCADMIVRTLQTSECQWILPCTGDRQFALTQDDEMCFAMPSGRIDEVVEGLRETHKFGVRYPVPAYLQWTAKFPPKYQQLHQMLNDQD